MPRRVYITSFSTGLTWVETTRFQLLSWMAHCTEYGVRSTERNSDKPFPILHSNPAWMTIAILKTCTKKQRNSCADKIDSKYGFRCSYQMISSPQIRDRYIYLSEADVNPDKVLCLASLVGAFSKHCKDANSKQEGLRSTTTTRAKREWCHIWDQVNYNHIIIDHSIFSVPQVSSRPRTDAGYLIKWVTVRQESREILRYLLLFWTGDPAPATLYHKPNAPHSSILPMSGLGLLVFFYSRASNKEELHYRIVR